MFLLAIFLFFEDGREHGIERGLEHGFEHGLEHGFEYDFEHDFEHSFASRFEHELKSEHQSYFDEAIHYLQFLHYQFFSKFILDFSLMSSFFRVNVSNPNKSDEYSSYEMESSDNAFQMSQLIVLSAETPQSFHVFQFSTKAF